MTDLSVIIVNWNAKGFLKDCLNSLQDSVDNGLCEVIVVDNGSTDGSIDMIHADYPKAILIETGSNLGFTKANNLGLAKAGSPYGLFLNSDTVVSTQALKAMIAALKSDPSLWAVGCEQITSTGEPWTPFGRFPTLKSEFVTLTGAFNWPPVKYLINYRKNRKLRATVAIDNTALDSAEASNSSSFAAYVDYVSASCIMFERENISKLGGLDENYFFHSEDVDLCLRIKKAGGKVGYIPSVSINHYLGGSQSTHYRKLLRQWMFTRLFLFRKHYGAIMHFLLLCIYALAGSGSIAKWTCIYLFKPQSRNEASDWISFWASFASKSKAEQELKSMGSV